MTKFPVFAGLLSLLVVAFTVGATISPEDPPPLFTCSSFLANLELQILANYSYVVYVNNELWLYGGKVNVRANNQWYDSELGSLHVGTAGAYNGYDTLGSFYGYEVNYTANDQSFGVTTRFKCYSPFAPTYGALRFETIFPQEITNTSTDNLDTRPSSSPWRRTKVAGGEFNSSSLPLVQFPSFVCMPYNRLGGSLGFLEWNGRFTNDNIAIGNGLRGFTGGQTGGPLIIYDSNTTVWQPGTGNMKLSKPYSLLLAPLDQVKSSILGIVEDVAHPGTLWRLAGGPQGHITSLPNGYTYSFLLLASPYGITNVTYNYGSAVRSFYNSWKLGGNVQDIQASVIDPLTYKVSYWTDNGAYYYAGYWNKYLNSTNNGNTLFPILYDYHLNHGIPIGTYQLDPWWYPQIDNGCNNWTYDTSIFPSGLDPLVNYGMEFTLYSSYYGGNLTVMNEGMPGYDWRLSEYFNVGWFEGYVSLPSIDQTYNFYRDMFARAKTNGWGLTNYEIDFMDFLNLVFTEHNTNATALQAWETAVGAAALDAEMTVQLCMDLPSDALFSAQAPAFTNARASEDDFPTNDDRWDIGITSILYGAMNLKPFYDDFWTTPVQPRDDNPYGPEAMENFTEVSAMISVLSTGPVGISDGIGFTNGSLVNMTCMGDGRILKPSLPAGMIDAYYAPRTGNRYGIPGEGVILAAPSFVPLTASTAFPSLATAGTVDAPTAYPFMTVLAIDVPSPGFTLYPWDLSPDITTTNVTLGPRVVTEDPNKANATVVIPSTGTVKVSVQSYVSIPWAVGMANILNACQNGAPACGCVTMFNPTNPLMIQTGSENSDHSKPHEMYSLSPLYTSGWSVIGELTKITRVSVQRFNYINGGNSSSSSLLFAVNGTAGETVEIAVVVPPVAGKQTGSCAVPPLIGGMGIPSSDTDNTVVQGTIQIVNLMFTETGQQTVTCGGNGGSAKCTVTEGKVEG